jgi:choline dehydrogenase-like flavoprotein
MNIIDGSDIRSAVHKTADVVIVGTGPAGAAAARTLASHGVHVVLLDEGPYVRPEQFPADGFSAMARMYRDMGASLSRGAPMMPLVQGRVVGGTSVVNGAISWRLPRDVHQEWVDADPALGDSLPWSELEPLFDRVEDHLNIRPTDEAISGANNLLLKKGADALGIENRPISRNVRGCRGLGRCLQGCPEGHKMSMEVSYLPDACRDGAEIFSDVRVDRVVVERGRAVGVTGVAKGGGAVTVVAAHAVVLAASAIQTPALLMRSGLRKGPVGENFQCHPGASLSGRFAEPVRLWTGATQGHEAIGLRKQGIKFEALGYDMTLVATRLKGVGAALSRDIEDMAHQAHWGAAIRASARGKVSVFGGRPSVKLTLGDQDMRLVRRGVSVLGQMMLAAGADYVEPGVHGWKGRSSDRSEMADFADSGPIDPRAYMMAVTHMFGTCAMGSDPARSVVRPDFRHHYTERLYVADSSVFPSNTGVNPQTSIIALATMCGRRVAEAVGAA